MTNFKVFTLNDVREWNEYLKKLPNGSKDIYFTPDYYLLYEQDGDGVANCFVFEKDGKIALYPFLKNSINVLGYQLDNEYYDIQGAYGYNGVISSSYEADFIKSFYKEIDMFCKDNKIIAEFTRFHPLINNVEFKSNDAMIIFDRNTVGLNICQSYENIWEKEYSSKNRNMIRKARKIGLNSVIMHTVSLAEIEKFIDIYMHTMKMLNADSFYFFSKYYFVKMFDVLQNYIYLMHIKNGKDEVVCSSIFFHYHDFFHYHLSGRASNADNTVNNYLLDEAIKFAQFKGAKMFHFGGGSTSATYDSLLKFKRNFSRSFFDFNIGKRIHNQEVYKNIVKQWEAKNPESYRENYNKLLGYREIEYE